MEVTNNISHEDTGLTIRKGARYEVQGKNRWGVRRLSDTWGVFRSPFPSVTCASSIHCMYWDKDGNPEPVEDDRAWAGWFEEANRTVAQDEVGPYKVSTVFLGADHSWGHGAPVLYETLIFGHPDGEGEHMERFHTKPEAVDGHRHAINVAKAWVE